MAISKIITKYFQRLFLECHRITFFFSIFFKFCISLKSAYSKEVETLLSSIRFETVDNSMLQAIKT